MPCVEYGERKSMEMKSKISFLDAVAIENKLWFSNLDYNALMRMDIQTGETYIISYFPKNEIYQEELHRKVFLYKKKLYFIPLKSHYIHIWNMEREEWDETMELPFSESETICDAYMIDENIWIFPSSLKNDIIRWNLKSNKILCLIGLTDEIRKCTDIFSYMLGYSSVCYKDNCFYLSPRNTRDIYIIETRRCILKKKQQLPEAILTQGICPSSERGLWITELYSGHVHLWEENLGIVNTYYLEVPLSVGNIPFIKVIDSGTNQIMVLPCHSEDILFLDKSQRLIHKCVYPKSFCRERVYTLFCGFCSYEQDYVLLFPRSSNQLLKVNIKDMSITGSTIHLNSIDFEREKEILILQKKKKISDGSLQESCNDSLLSFFLNEVECMEDVPETTNMNIGEKIYNHLIL